MTNWVTVRTFENPIEANIIKGLLESEHIPTFLIGEHFLASQLLFNAALGDIRLQVPLEFAPAVKQLLADYKQGVLEAQLIDEFALKSPTCSQCGCADFENKTAFKSIAKIFMLFCFAGKVAPAPKYQTCKQCKHKL